VRHDNGGCACNGVAPGVEHVIQLDFTRGEVRCSCGNDLREMHDLGAISVRVPDPAA
jgi:hypothetical protein